MGWLGFNAEYFYNLSAKIDASNELQNNTRALERLGQLGDKLSEQAHNLEGEIAKETAKESSTEEDKNKDKDTTKEKPPEASASKGRANETTSKPATTVKEASKATSAPQPRSETQAPPTPTPLIPPKTLNQLKLEKLKIKQQQLQGYRKALELRNESLKKRIEHYTAKADEAKKQIDSRNGEFAYFWS